MKSDEWLSCHDRRNHLRRRPGPAAPLAAAQLYRRAHNAKTPLDRHNAAYCLWEAALKLLGSVAIVAYAERGATAPELARAARRTSRGRPWATGGSSSGCSLPVAGRGRRRGLPRRLRELRAGPPARRPAPRRGPRRRPARCPGRRLRRRRHGAPQRAVRPMVRYRNQRDGPRRRRPACDRLLRPHGPGHPARRGRDPRPARRAGRPPSGLRRRRPPPGVRPLADRALRADRRDVPAARIARSVPSPRRPACRARAALPRTPGDPDRGRRGRCTRWCSYDHETAEVFFLNARRGRRRTEYLCYHPGRSVERTDLGDEQRRCWPASWAWRWTPRQVERWAARSQAEEPPLPASAAEDAAAAPHGRVRAPERAGPRRHGRSSTAPGSPRSAGRWRSSACCRPATRRPRPGSIARSTSWAGSSTRTWSRSSRRAPRPTSGSTRWSWSRGRPWRPSAASCRARARVPRTWTWRPGTPR